MVIALIIILTTLILSLITSNRILAPTTIISSIWLFIILAYWVYPHGYYPLKGQFYTAISLWVFFFGLFAMLRQSISVSKRHTEPPTKLIRDIYFIIALITFPISVFKIYSAIQEFGISSNIFAGLRDIALGSIQGMDEGLSNNYFATLWLVAYAIELLHYNKKNLYRILILLVINIAWAFLIMAKISFLLIFFVSLSILFFKDVIRPKVIFISLGVIFLFFTFVQVIRTTGAESKDDLRYDFFSLYVLSGVPAFEKVAPSSSQHYGESTFRFFYKVAEKIGIVDVEAADSLQEFTNVGVKKKSNTNIYTTMYPFYKDFGYWGIVIFAMLTGLLYGYLYKAVVTEVYPSIIVYSIMMTSLFIQFMSENTFTAFSFLIQIIIFSYLPYWLNGVLGKNKTVPEE